MRIQIIKLDENDDLASARDKLSWGKTTRVILVWPAHSDILSNQLDLTLLSRYSKANGSQLGFVTDNQEIRDNARLLGIPVFSSEGKALKSRWKLAKKPGTSRLHTFVDFRAWKNDLVSENPLLEEDKKKKWWGKGWVKYVAFSLAILAVVSIICLFVPSALIVLSPKSQPQAASLMVLASDQSKAVNISGVVPLRTLMVTVEGEDTAPTTGISKVGDKFATGEVTFTNLSEQALDIPAGTVVEPLNSPELKFSTTTDKTLPAGNGKTMLVPVTAEKPGSEGNVEANAITAIEGSLGLQATVANAQTVSGGTDKTAAIVSSSDEQSLHERLVNSLQSNAISQLKGKLSSGDILIEDSLGKMTILDEVSDPTKGQAAEQFTLSMRIEFTAQYIAADDLLALGALNLNATLEQGFEPVANSLIFAVKEKPERDADQNVHLQVSFTRSIKNQIDAGRIPVLLMGHSYDQARSELKNLYPLSEEPQIAVTPSWWPNLPLVPFRIAVMEQAHANNGH